MNIGENIKEYRKSNKISQRKLAKDAEVSFAYIQQLEKGDKSNPSLEVVKRIAKALNISTEQLTKLKIQKKINCLMQEKNISIEDMIKKTGLMKEQLPIGEGGLIYSSEVLYKVSNVLNMSIEDMIKGTDIEDYVLLESIKKVASNRINNLNEKKEMPIQERRKLDNISISTMALLLNLTEEDIENFEEEPSKYPVIKSKYIKMLINVEDFKENLFNTILNTNNVALKTIFDLPPQQYSMLINYISANIGLISEIIRFSVINANQNFESTNTTDLSAKE